MVKKRLSKKQLDKKFDCCSEGKCSLNSKEVSVYFCPKCKSKEVGYIFTFRNIFGIIPKMRCRKCKFEAMTFPILTVGGKK